MKEENKAEEHPGADIILRSTAVFSAKQGSPYDTPCEGSIAVKGDRIVWAGSTKKMPERLRGDATVVVDWGNALIMPGFHDAHLHFFHSALYRSALAEHFVGENEADAVARLAPLATRREKDSWLLAQGWREYRWNPPRMPHRRSLDAVYPDRPVAMYSGDAHTLWLNTCGLNRLGIDENSTAPSGGSYDKDTCGRLTGIVRETAAMELMARIAADFTTEELLGAYRDFQAYLNSRGITAVCDMSLMAMPGLDFVRDDLFSLLAEKGALTVRVSMFPTLLEDTGRLRSLQKRCTSPLLRACGLKQFFDGVSSQHTAWLHDPYTNARFEGDRGGPSISPQALEALVQAAAQDGRAVRIHAIGDEAIHRCIDIFERHPPERYSPEHHPSEHHPSEHHLPECHPSFDADKRRHVIEHLENFQPDDIERLAKAGIVASVQPCHMTLDPGGPERDLGKSRTPYMWPFRSLLDAGCTLAFGSDSPTVDSDPIDAVYTAVCRRDAESHKPPQGWIPQERITLAEALRAYTQGSAQAAQRVHEMGTIEPGMLADLVVLSPDPFTLPADDIQKARVMATYVGGRKVYG